MRTVTVVVPSGFCTSFSVTTLLSGLPAWPYGAATARKAYVGAAEAASGSNSRPSIRQIFSELRTAWRGDDMNMVAGAPFWNWELPTTAIVMKRLHDADLQQS